MAKTTHIPTDIELAMLAAYIDGEGCIQIRESLNNRSKTRRTFPLVNVTNCDIRLMHWLTRTFGGTVCSNRYKDFNPKWNDSYRWCMEGKRAVSLLRECLPYFLLKVEQAKIVIAHEELVISLRSGSHNSRESRDAYLNSRETRLGFKHELAKHKTRGKLPEVAETLTIQ